MAAVTHPALSHLFQLVHTLRLFPDSKTIVDMPLKAPPLDVATAFASLDLSPINPSPSTIKYFMDQWFLPPGSDLDTLEGIYTTTFSYPSPHWLPTVTDPDLRHWAQALLQLWPLLLRKTNPHVASHPLQHTLLPLPNPFIIPGSRFVECYYWDSLWVIKGLLTCCCITSNSGEGDDDSSATTTTITTTVQIHQLVKGMIENFFYCIEKYGFVPNGCRSYYLNRSQPPLLSEMVMALVEHCDDDDDDRQEGGTTAEGASSSTIADVVDLPFLQRALDCLLIEHEYWTSSPRCINVEVGKNDKNNNYSGVYRLARYWADWDEPRPESWREDVDTTNGTTNGTLYRDIAAAAESGWDFSSRWLKDGTSLSTIETTNIIPVDLNAYLYQMESNIVKLADKVGREEVGGEYRELARLRREAVERLFWDGGQWRDLRIIRRYNGENIGDHHHHHGGHHHTHHHRVHVYGKDVVHKESTGIYASNWIPLACGCVDKNSKEAAAAVESLVKSGLLSAPGGVATTLHKTGQQWDWPNAWPPIQCLLEEGCRLYGGDVGGRFAGDIGKRFLKSAYLGWKGSGGDGGGGGVMFEKFDVERVGVAGGGGEYECASGFGWTNGVALVFLSRYGGY